MLCCLLVGLSTVYVEWALPYRNIKTDGDRFETGSIASHQTQQIALKAGWMYLGTYHSHPVYDVYPSLGDIEQMGTFHTSSTPDIHLCLIVAPFAAQLQEDKSSILLMDTVKITSEDKTITHWLPVR